MRTMTTSIALALLISLAGICTAAGQRSAIAGREAVLPTGTSDSETIVRSVFPRRGSFELLLGRASCSESSLTLDFTASGGTLQGLTPISGGGNYIPSLRVDVAECEATLVEIEHILEDRNCAVAPLSYGTGISLFCDGDRNEVVRTVALVMRAAFENAVTP